MQSDVMKQDFGGVGIWQGLSVAWPCVIQTARPAISTEQRGIFPTRVLHLPSLDLRDAEVSILEQSRKGSDRLAGLDFSPA